jgi:hypothetical protein
MEFAYDGGGLGKGGTAILYLDGDKLGVGPIAAAVPMLYSGDETCDVGYDSGTPSVTTTPAKTRTSTAHQMGSARLRNRRSRPPDQPATLLLSWPGAQLKPLGPYPRAACRGTRPSNQTFSPPSPVGWQAGGMGGSGVTSAVGAPKPAERLPFGEAQQRARVTGGSDG